jgi:lipopolysaccharide export system permease protein
MPIKIIDRYIIRELTKIFLISVGSLTMVLYLDRFLFIAEMIINRGVTFLEIFRIMAYISPSFLAITIPISVLFSSVATFNQFSGSNEWVAMKACHLSFLQIMRPVIFFSIITYLLTASIMIYALPWGNLAYKQLIFKIIKDRTNIDIKSNIFNYNFKNLVILANNREGDYSLTDVFIADSTQSKSPRIINAKKALILPNIESLKVQLELRNGTIHDTNDSQNEYQIIKFNGYEINLNIPDTERLEKDAMLGNRELSISQLINQINEFQKKGLPTNVTMVELSKKFAIPFTCLLFGLLGAPIGIKSNRSGKSGSIAISVLITITYYTALIFMQNMGKIGRIEPFISVWVPNIAILGIIIYTSFKMQRDLPFTFTRSLFDRLIILYIAIKMFFLNFSSKSLHKDIPPLKYGSNRQTIDEKTRKILQEKTKTLKKKI